MDENMIIRVGSKNPVKIEAIQECFPDSVLQPVAAPSGVKDQPMSLEETIEGSRNRAQMWKPGWGIGIESGLMEVEQASSGWMNTIACTIWNGEKFALGLAGGFVVPQAIMDIVLQSWASSVDECVDLSEAALRAGLTKEKRVGHSKGIVNILTEGKMARKPYIKQAIMMAMVQMNHPELY